ncbi:hypothetical protein F4813DRAFT_375321 [Daldinia decipiens]|uniref:uncharacterized protein n=1 Tax=Daldinia decipiens TaxID=326647 RepID=UPI0020C56FC8|nr:uncharacterized protein F4813DRAFT_375321 [Daldinia decipiens]KAI1653289.1 hypothetical protein F4813DRAFT_375321 [Daldinia decipiens]
MCVFSTKWVSHLSKQKNGRVHYTTVTRLPWCIFTTEQTKTWETRLEEYYKRRAVLIGAEMDADQLLLRYQEKMRIGTELHDFMS